MIKMKRALLIPLLFLALFLVGMGCSFSSEIDDEKSTNVLSMREKEKTTAKYPTQENQIGTTSPTHMLDQETTFKGWTGTPLEYGGEQPLRVLITNTGNNRIHYKIVYKDNITPVIEGDLEANESYKNTFNNTPHTFPGGTYYIDISNKDGTESSVKILTELVK